MTYFGLLKSLGTGRETRHGTRLPDQPWQRVSGLPGCKAQPRGGRVVVQVPLEDGTAVIIGTVEPEDDGTQVMRGVAAWCVAPTVQDMEAMAACLLGSWERGEFAGT